jgi:hypothetical protein
VLKSAETVEVASDEVVSNFERSRVLLMDKTDDSGNTVYKTAKNKIGEVAGLEDRNGDRVLMKVLKMRTGSAIHRLT